jgi:hypothetical protein
MNTSGTTSFNLDLSEITEEAFERCGKEMRSGYDLRTARRSLNLLTIEWANKGINLWTIEQAQLPININAGQISYPVPVDTIDVLDTVIRTGVGQNQVDINISRISESTYSSIPTKNAYGRPIQFWMDRQTGNVNGTASTTLSANVTASATTIEVVSTANLPTQGYINIGSETILYQNVGTSLTSNANQLLNCYRGINGTTAAAHSAGDSVYRNYLPSINIWPTGNPGTQYNLIYYRMRRMQDAGTGANSQDIPFRLVPAVVAGLAAKLAAKLDGVDPQRYLALKAEYDQAWQDAQDEDREKAAWRIVPRNMFYYR